MVLLIHSPSIKRCVHNLDTPRVVSPTAFIIIIHLNTFYVLEEYLKTLNDSQREAVIYCDGPQLVIAGAGSGKTRVLTMKIAYLLQQGYHPDRIIALTFTKKAATEMQNRIRDLVGPTWARRLWMGTFHSLFSRILRSEAERIGFKSDFTIYDQSDSRSLVKTIIKEMNLDDKKYKPNAIQCQISNAKNNLITPSMYRNHRELIQFDHHVGHPEFINIYERYCARCHQAGAMDFDDLLLYTNILFRDHPDVLESYQEHFQYVLVDEYQDTNRAQHLIVEQLVRRHRRLCVVGDDAQSIYSFRGANINNILKLRESIPGTQLFKLEQNYRSTRTIVDAANSLIRKNRAQIPKTIFSQNDQGSPISVLGTFSDLEEAYTVASKIVHLHDRMGYKYADCAILYRTNGQSRTLEEALRKQDVAYRIYGGLSFYQRREVKDVIAYLRLIINPADEEAFKRVINYPARGIGATTVGKLSEAVNQHNITFFEACKAPEQFGVSVNRGTAAKLEGFTALIERFAEMNQTVDAYNLTLALLHEAGIKADLAADTSIEGKARQENVEELLSAIHSFVETSLEEGATECHLTDFLADVSLSGDVEPDSDTSDDEEEDRVTLMTIHAAKGLEFKNVFVVGLEENLLPNDMALNEPGGVEEERRLFYVALTRAEENCFISYATSRFRNGRTEMGRPSRFLTDIDPQYLDRRDTGASSSSVYTASPAARPFSSGVFRSETSPSAAPSTFRPNASPVSAPKSSVLDFTGKVTKLAGKKEHTACDSILYGGHPLSSGTVIQHERFGRGVITQLSGEAENARITVRFETFGEKTLLLKFARFNIES